MPRDILDLPPPPADKRIRYGPEPLHYGDLRVPHRAGPFPAIMFIHGGFWRSRFTLDHSGHICAALARAGIATWSIEYRRVGDAGGGWPGTAQDVLLALEFLPGLAHDYSLDPHRTAVMGHSAGGHLSLWAAAQNKIALRTAISLGGVVDLRRGFELHLGSGAVQEFMGASPKDAPEQYRAASPIELLPIPTPQLLIHGAKDEVVPVELSESYVKASSNARLVRLDGGDHFDVIDPRSAHWAVVEKNIAGAVDLAARSA